MSGRQVRNLLVAGTALTFAAVYGIVAWSLDGDSFTAVEEEASMFRVKACSNVAVAVLPQSLADVGDTCPRCGAWFTKAGGIHGRRCSLAPRSAP